MGDTVPFLYRSAMYDGRIISISMIEGRDKAEEADGLRFEMQLMLKEWSGYK